MALGLGFLALSVGVRLGLTLGVDEGLLLALRTPGSPADPIGPAWVEAAIRDVTALGSMSILILLSLMVAGYLWCCGRGRAGGMLLTATFGAVLLANLAKLVFDRPRPTLVTHATSIFTSSYPSAHATMTAATFLVLAMVLTRTAPAGAPRRYLIGCALLVTGLVGFSRVYLGVHYPSDVLAGWLLGTGWAVICRQLMARQQRH